MCPQRTRRDLFKPSAAGRDASPLSPRCQSNFLRRRTLLTLLIPPFLSRRRRTESGARRFSRWWRRTKVRPTRTSVWLNCSSFLARAWANRVCMEPRAYDCPKAKTLTRNHLGIVRMLVLCRFRNSTVQTLRITVHTLACALPASAPGVLSRKFSGTRLWPFNIQGRQRDMH